MAINFTVAGLEEPTRLDRVLRGRFPQWGRQAAHRLISDRKVTVNRRTVWLASWAVHNGDQVQILESPLPKPAAPERFDEGWLIAETPELVVVNKPAGLLSEPTRWGQGANLLDLATARFGRLILFHRLDRDTSGVILLTRPGPINQQLDQAFKRHTVTKEYLAVVHAPNRLAPSGVIDLRLAPDPRRRDRMVVAVRGGQRAVTHYAIEEERDGRQLVRLWPETGRTHQLRVHLAHSGAPILGDRIYGSQPPTGERLMLHAYQITLPEMAGAQGHKFVAPLPVPFWPTPSSTKR